MSGSPECQAAEWAGRLDRGVTPEERRELASWLASDPRNAAELAALGAASEALTRIACDPDVEALADSTLRAVYRGRAQRTWLAVAGCAAAVVAAVFVVRSVREPAAPAAAPAPPAGHYVVLPPTARIANLPDGSVAELNGDARIEVRYSASERRVELLAGEAFFTVAKDAAKPFVVATATGSVRAVGTAFNVRLLSNGAEVIVTEGRVNLERGGAAPDTALSAGNAGHWSAAAPTTVAAMSQFEMDDALGWRTRRLEFNSATVPEAVAAMNYFNAKKITLDANVTSEPISGIVRADSLDGLIRLLAHQSLIETQATADGQLHIRAKK